MIPLFAAKALPFIKDWWKAAAGFIIGALMTAPLSYCEGKDAAFAEYKADRAEANVEALVQDAEANAAASDARVADAIAITEQRKDLVDAIAEVPDSVPDAVRVQLGCQRLRRAGTPEADLSPACRPAD